MVVKCDSYFVLFFLSFYQQQKKYFVQNLSNELVILNCSSKNYLVSFYFHQIKCK